MNHDIRWKQRFSNYEKAFRLLSEALADVDELSELEKEGAVQDSSSPSNWDGRH